MPLSDQAATLVRGPLKYVVETSTPQTEAGKEFSVSVRITNPYEVPVTIRGVATKLPAKFITPNGEAETAHRRRPLFGVEISGISVWPFAAPPEGGAVVKATGGAA